MLNSGYFSGKKPTASPSLALLELPRTVTEKAWLNVAKPGLAQAPKGDGHSVLIIPGFLGDDSYNQPLCDYLNALGYDASGWNLGPNIGPRPDITSGIEKLVLDTYARSGRKLTLIGHSLGGLYAREMARDQPDKVRQVISLGSPIGERDDSKQMVAKLYKYLNGPVDPEQLKQGEVAPPVPTTAIFSRTDGVVPWQAAVQLNGHSQCQNIEVFGSHSGLSVNASVWRLLAERLAQAEDKWQPLAATGSLRWMIPIQRPIVGE